MGRPELPELGSFHWLIRDFVKLCTATFKELGVCTPCALGCTSEQRLRAHIVIQVHMWASVAMGAVNDLLVWSPERL